MKTIDGICSVKAAIAALQEMDRLVCEEEVYLHSAGQQYAGASFRLLQDICDGEFFLEISPDP